MLRSMKVFCYAEVTGRSRRRRCWRATFQGITRCSSSKRCAWGGKQTPSRPSCTIGSIDCQCLKKRTLKLCVLSERTILKKSAKVLFPLNQDNHALSANVEIGVPRVRHSTSLIDQCISVVLRSDVVADYFDEGAGSLKNRDDGGLGWRQGDGREFGDGMDRMDRMDSPYCTSVILSQLP